MRSSRGQGTVEYVGIITLVAVVLAGLSVTVGVPWLGPKLAQTIRLGVCIVSGSYCDSASAARAGLKPCPIQRRSNRERTSATVLIRLELGNALVVERFSDGTASVSFVDGRGAGVELGLGAKLGAGAEATASVTTTFQQGRRYDFPDWGAAQAFLGRFAGQETTTGEGLKVLRRVCPVCPKRLVGATRALPPATATFSERGLMSELRAELGVDLRLGGSGKATRGAGGPGRRLDPRVADAALDQLDLPGADAELRHAAVLGSRTEGARRTVYVRLQAGATQHLGAVLGSLTEAGDAEGVLEVTSERGRAVEAKVRAYGSVDAEAQLGSVSGDLGGLATRLRGAVRQGAQGGGTGGAGVEGTVSLDLRDPANAAAVDGLLHPGLSPAGWVERARALGRRLDAGGAVDLDLYRTSREDADHTAGIGGVARIGAGHQRQELTRDLVSAWSRLPGAELRRREDCELAATGNPA